jgi:hypothetical protein
MPAWFWDTLAVIATLVLLAAVIWFIRSILPKLRVQAPTPVTVEEERDSVFSWGRLFSRLRAWLVRLVGRTRRRPRAVPGGQVATAAVDTEREVGIRFEYRRVLGAARAHGHGRGHAETTNELELRLVNAAVAGDTSDELRQLTALYDHARYGGLEPQHEQIASAQQASDAVIRAMDAIALERTLEAAALQALGVSAQNPRKPEEPLSAEQPNPGRPEQRNWGKPHGERPPSGPLRGPT